MRVGLSNGLSTKRSESSLSGPIFSGPVNRAHSGSERHAIEIIRFKLDLHWARFAVPFAKLLEPGSNDQRTVLCSRVAQGETVGTSTSAGVPATLALNRFGHFNGAIARNGTPLANVVSASVT